MANVIVRWTTENQVIPDALDYTQYLVKAGSQEQLVELGVQEATFEMEAGTFMFSVDLVKADGVTSGGHVEMEFEVPAPPATAPVPVSVVVNLG